MLSKDALIQTLASPSQEFFLNSMFRDFGFIWSFLISICNFFIFIFSAFWIGAPTHPEGVSLFFLIFFEIFLCIDLFLQILIKKMKIDMKFFIFLEFGSYRHKLFAVLSILSSLPITIIFTAIESEHDFSDKKNLYFGNVLFLKLFRLINIIMFVKKFKEMLIFMNIKAMILLKFIENTIILVLAIHIAACLWMFVSRNETDGCIFY